MWQDPGVLFLVLGTHRLRLKHPWLSSMLEVTLDPSCVLVTSKHLLG